MIPIPKCGQCGQPFDTEALTFWLGESTESIPWSDRTCSPCYYEWTFGTRTPTAQQFIDLGWPVPKGVAA